MRKKILGFVVAFIAIFAMESVSADTIKCYYKLPTKKVEISFVIKNNKIKDKAIIKEGKKTNEEKIQNWKSKLEGTTYVGRDEFKKTQKCPENIVLVKSNTGYNLYATDDASKKDFMTAVEDKYSTIKYKYTVPYTGSKNETTDEYEEVETEDQEEFEAGSGFGCMDFTTKDRCEDEEKQYHKQFACIWNETPYGDYCNVDKLLYVKCGGSYDIPYQAPQIISFIINILKIATPIILIMFGIITLLKAMMSTSEDELKKAQKSLIKKIIASVMVFFVVTIVQFVITKVSDETTNFSDCLNCFVNNKCTDSVYYKNNVLGTYMCQDFSGGESKLCEEYYKK